MKTCYRCKRCLPAESFRPKKTTKDGLRSECIECGAALHRQWYERTKAERAAAYRAKTSEWRAKTGNAEKNRQTAAAWYRGNALNREIAKTRAREWAANNRERKRATDKAYREANRAKYNASKAKYLAKCRQATPSWANLFFIGEAYHLAEVRSRVTGVKYHVDHIVPLQNDRVCGLHVESNLEVIPWRENLAKGNRYWPDMP